MGVESHLGGGVGLPLVDGKASSVPVTALIVLIIEAGLLGCVTYWRLSLILKTSPFCSLNSLAIGLKPLTLECTLCIHHKA